MDQLLNEMELQEDYGKWIDLNYNIQARGHTFFFIFLFYDNYWIEID